MDMFFIRCVLGDIEAMAVVEVSVRLISHRRGSQGVGVRAVDRQPRRPGLARSAMMCGLGR